MKKLVAILGLGLTLSFGNAFAAGASAPEAAAPAAKTAQQGKMAACNKEAGDKKGDERKAFMKQCLGAKPVAAVSEKGKSPKQLAQQEKMKACNKEAGDKALKGDARKAFMKDCLSNKG
ncbi:MAG: phosphate starvation-inducible protein PsiF [Comamonadaceae bacterium CG17_big_fil_post_rev_8_21_14_2_50_60_13]|nr:MAG: phosphate starvation-inducible protein PsiF [Comamonadaceae bacterium CG17_big_fil_post_rev_8_21_14_2_50_60_13]